MAATAAVGEVKSPEAPKSNKRGWFDLALAMHLASGRFSSPAGIVFVHHNYLPQLLKRPG